MKKLTILILAIGLVSLYSCKKDEDRAVLTDYTAAQLLSPPQGSYILKEALKDSVLFTYTWSAAAYNPTDLVKPVYTLEMDTAGNNFNSPKVLTSSATSFSFTITHGTMNNMILGVFSGIPDALSTFEFRVTSQLSGSGAACTKHSAVLSLDITPYSQVVIVPPIYLLGDATTIGWDNMKALEMTHLTNGQFAIVEHLSGGGKFIKFIADRGFWAPQWGTDATGTWDAGPMVYRPTESVPDPAGIPSPDNEGDFWIMADTANLVYQVQATSAQLYLIGDATTAGWDNTKGIEFTKVSPGIFTLTTNLTAGGMKLLEVLGQWAPQWGTDASATPNFGNLVYRPTESVPDPPSLTSPGTGTFTIEANLITKTFKITAK